MLEENGYITSHFAGAPAPNDFAGTPAPNGLRRSTSPERTHACYNLQQLVETLSNISTPPEGVVGGFQAADQTAPELSISSLRIHLDSQAWQQHTLASLKPFRRSTSP